MVISEKDQQKIADALTSFPHSRRSPIQTWMVITSVALLLIVFVLVSIIWTQNQASAEAQRNRVAERAQFEQTIRTVLDGQNKLSRKYDAQGEDLDRIIAWVQSLGYDIPPSVIRTKTVRSHNGGSSHNSSSGGSGGQTIPKALPPPVNQEAPEDPNLIKDLTEAVPKVVNTVGDTAKDLVSPKKATSQESNTPEPTNTPGLVEGLLNDLP